MSNPKCPYCGKTMALRLFNGFFSFRCPECGAASPDCETREEAYAAAMKRKRPKGEWLEAQEYLFDNVYTCSACGSEQVLVEGTPKDNEYNFCPNCGADMQEEVNNDA